MKAKSKGVLLVVFLLLLAGCTPPATPGIANPASVYCQEQGGRLEIRTAEDGGQAGYCLFADGSECEEWAFFRGECVPGGVYQPLDAETCGALAEAMAHPLDVEVVTTQAPFQDYISGGFGVGCQMTATGTGLDFESFPVVAEALKAMLGEGGWEEDIQYAADGPTGTASDLRQANALCLMRVNWNPSEDAHCPEDQPISTCELKPEQRLYEIVLQCARDTSAGQ